jgi:Flp pilus assembly protein TadD
MRKITFLVFGLLAGCFLLTSCGMEIQKDSAINPNTPAPPAVQPPAQQNTTASSAGNVSIDEKLDEFEKCSLKEQIASYKESVSCLKWAIGSLVGLSLAAVGFIVFKNEKAYKEAIADAKDAAKQAREEAKVASEHREKACEWEQKAREKYEGIDEQIKTRIERFNEQADDKFKEIDGKIEGLGDKITKRVIKEYEKQQEISEKRRSALRAYDEKNYELADNLFTEIVRENPADHRDFYNWGVTLSDWAEFSVPEAEKRYQGACEKYQRATELKPDYYQAFGNWGAALQKLAQLSGTEAERYYQEACAKYQRVIEIKPDDYQAFNNWGAALLKLAQLSGVGAQAERYYQDACAKCQKAVEIKPDGCQAFNNWGTTLSNWADLGGPEAERRYQEACAKYQIATKLEPNYYQAFYNWGIALLCWSRLKEGQEREKLFQKAEDVLLRAGKIKKGGGAYNLACLFALRNDPEKCKYWLKVGEEAGTLETREDAMKDDDLVSMREKDWFKAIHWKGE